DWAKKIYAWEREHLFDPETGAVTDLFNERTGTKIGVPLTYNQGTFLGAAHELYKLTGDIQYLRDAEKAATYTITNRSTIDYINGILRDEGRGDGALFKGIFIRYFVQLMLEKELKPEIRAQYRDFLYHNAEVLWTRGVKQEEPLFSQAWSRPPGTSTQLTAQTSGCMLLEALAFYEKSQAQTK
ncbi:MAG TPA: glycoside hydrolase family 76 protein, partial [Verrucomicrobiota bacterium]|nr:glycoside hydrolase family 76 protein [Verrucomicrobiota bacterium]